MAEAVSAPSKPETAEISLGNLVLDTTLQNAAKLLLLVWIVALMLTSTTDITHTKGL